MWVYKVQNAILQIKSVRLFMTDLFYSDTQHYELVLKDIISSL